MDQQALIALAAALARPFAPSEQSEVQTVVAVNQAGAVLPPCGRCRELLWQVDRRNAATWVVLGPGDGATLADLLPRR